MDAMFGTMSGMLPFNNHYRRQLLTLATLYSILYNKWVNKYDADWAMVRGREWVDIETHIQSIFADSPSHLPCSSSSTKEQLTYIVCLCVGSRLSEKTKNTTGEGGGGIVMFFNLLEAHRRYVLASVVALFAIMRKLEPYYHSSSSSYKQYIFTSPKFFVALFVFVYFGKLVWDCVCWVVGFFWYQKISNMNKLFLNEFVNQHEHLQKEARRHYEGEKVHHVNTLIRIGVSITMMIEYGITNFPHILQRLVKEQQQCSRRRRQQKNKNKEEEEKEEDEDEEELDLLFFLNQTTWIIPQLKEMLLLSRSYFKNKQKNNE